MNTAMLLDIDPIFHLGEQAVQERAGTRERMAQIGTRVIRDYMPDQHREFFPLLPFVVAGTMDAAGQPWASLLAGEPGFLQSPDPQLLTVATSPLWGDKLNETLAEGAPIGLLGIQQHTRRRNRMNGVVRALRPDGFAVDVQHSFGNCPKYIQPREPRYAADAVQPEKRRLVESTTLDAEARRIIANADAFFIATSSGSITHGAGAGVDVSHRGGAPGFVRLQPDGTLAVPDYPGNNFFNTLGNLQVEPRAGLLFIDFASGTMLQLAVTAEVLWADELDQPVGDIERVKVFTVHAVRRIEGALPLEWAPV